MMTTDTVDRLWEESRPSPPARCGDLVRHLPTGLILSVIATDTVGQLQTRHEGQLRLAMQRDCAVINRVSDKEHRAAIAEREARERPMRWAATALLAVLASITCVLVVIAST